MTRIAILAGLFVVGLAALVAALVIMWGHPSSVPMMLGGLLATEAALAAELLLFRKARRLISETRTN
jgi:hypothetical protein